MVLLEAQPRVLARVAGEPLSTFYEAIHRARGVELRLETAIESIIGVEGRATGVRLQDGSSIPADIVIVGIGISPCVEPLVAAGAETGNGVIVDAFCRTFLPDAAAVVAPDRLADLSHPLRGMAS